MPDYIDPLTKLMREYNAFEEQASQEIHALCSAIDRLREERAQLRRALHETAYCLNSLDVAPSTMTKATADTIVQLNLGGFND
jgi:hypothetical protein